jgi:nucleotidyltransferase/DNA polymerase involved in DNA repair
MNVLVNALLNALLNLLLNVQRGASSVNEGLRSGMAVSDHLRQAIGVAYRRVLCALVMRRKGADAKGKS